MSASAAARRSSLARGDAAPAASPQRLAGTAHDAVVWHDLECGGYEADLPLWRALATEAAAGPCGDVLDVGAGSGRVSIDLARRGHRVTALDIDGRLLAALGERAEGLPVARVRCDARQMSLAGAGFDLCIVPMQTLQLLRGAGERAGLLRGAHAALRPDGLFACAIVAELEPFDCSAGGPGPSPETAVHDGRRYSSRAVRVEVGRRTVTIERRRSVEGVGGQTDIVVLERIGAAALRRELRAAGLAPQRTRVVPDTAEHVGSLVAVARAR